MKHPGKDPLDINMNGLLSSSLAKDKRVGNFFVGAKFTVLFQMNKEKPKKKPEPKPQRTPPPPRAPRPVPPTFYGKIVDAETNKDMEVELVINKMPEKRQVFKGLANKKTGLITRRLPAAGEYELIVSKEGYLNYVETIEMTKSDTIIIAMEKIPAPEEPIIMHDLLFELNSANIHPSSEQALQDLYLLMNKNPKITIDITGHTDNTGQAAYNQKLSENRAKAVYDDLVRRGIDPSRLTYSGKGATQPIATNETEEGRATNRRVEFTINENKDK